MKTRFLLFCMLCLIINSCATLQTPSYVRQSIGGYNGNKTNIKDLINTDGYFIHAEPEPATDSTYFYFMFFEDGMVNMRVHDYNVFPKSKVENISQYINQVVSNKEGKQAKTFYNSLGWGKYIIDGDTIKVNYHSGWGYPDCYAFEIWFKIIDRNHISDIYFARITKNTPQKTITQKRENIYDDAIVSRFVPLDKMPSSDCWLKKEKWLWENEQDWKIYMDNLKEREDRNKRK